MKILRQRLPMPFVLLCICSAFFWKLVFTRQYTWLDNPDIVYQVMPWLQAQAIQWQSGHFPLWDTHLWGGQPWIGQIQPGTLNPLNWILFSIPLRKGFLQQSVLHWYFVLIHYIGALCFYYFLRKLDISRPGALFGACVFGLGGYMGTTGWPQLLMSAVLLPLILLFFVKSWQREGARQENSVFFAATCGALLGLSFLTGHHNVPIFSAVGMLLLWAWRLAYADRWIRSRMMVPLGAFLACFLLIAAIQMLPALEIGNLSIRWVNAAAPVALKERVPYYVHQEYSLRPETLVGLVLPNVARGWDPFLGVVAISMALVGLLGNWRLPVVRLLGGVALAGLVFGLGGFSFFHGLLYAVVPGLDKARSPGMATAILHMGLAGLAGYGLDTCRSFRRASYLPLGLAIAGSVLLLFTTAVVLITPDKAYEQSRIAFTGIMSLSMALLLWLWFRGMLTNRSASMATVLMLLFELNPVATYAYRNTDQNPFALPKLRENHDLAEYLKSLPMRVRVEVDHKEIPYNFGDWFGIDETAGYQPGVLKNIFALGYSGRVRDLLAVSHYIGRAPNRDGQTVLFEGRSGLKIFQNPTALPRVWSAHHTAVFPDEASAGAAVGAGPIELRSTVVLEETGPHLDTCKTGDEVAIQSYEPTRVSISATMGCRGIVVLADSWFPGWEVWVDGKRTILERAYTCLRSVTVERGRHQVEFRYRPNNLLVAILLGLSGFLLWGFCFLRVCPVFVEHSLLRGAVCKAEVARQS